MRATHLADETGKLPRRIPGQISRGFAFQIHAQVGGDSYGKVVYFVN